MENGGKRAWKNGAKQQMENGVKIAFQNDNQAAARHKNKEAETAGIDNYQSSKTKVCRLASTESANALTGPADAASSPNESQESSPTSSLLVDSSPSSRFRAVISEITNRVPGRQPNS